LPTYSFLAKIELRNGSLTTRSTLSGSRRKGFQVKPGGREGERGKQGPDLGSQRCYSVVGPTTHIITKDLKD
jgi:hypothetical protein